MKYNTYDEWVGSLRPTKRLRDLDQPIGTWTEREILPDGRTGTVGTIIVNNRECPYRCVMCGLWQDTVDHTPKPGQIVEQITSALRKFGRLDALKLYNAGSFFDEDAIPAEDRPPIAAACRDIDWVIVECRPDLIDDRVAEFASRLSGRLQVAIGLETVDAMILALLNKRMTLGDYERGTAFLNDRQIAHRAFIMVKPPLCNEARGLELGRASIEFAVRCGAKTISLIPTHITPGAMAELERANFVRPPSPWSLFRLADQALHRNDIHVLVDTWTLRRSAHCDVCIEPMDAAFRTLNERQTLPSVSCPCESKYATLLEDEIVRGAPEYKSWLRERIRSSRTIAEAIQ